MTTNPITPTATTDTIGVILAGGQSSRMGTDKASLRIGHESLLLRARRVLQEAGCNRVFLSGHLRSDWTDEYIPDQQRGAGPVGGIISALCWAYENTEPNIRILFVPVDAPLLSPLLLASMLHLAKSGDGCFIPSSPLPVVLRTTESALRRCEMALNDLRANGSWSVKRFVEPLALTQLEADHVTRSFLVNVNTPSQWKNLLHELENRT